MISIDPFSLSIQIANFLFLIWVMNVILYRPIRSILLKRKEKISGLEKGISSVKQDMKDKEESFANGIKEARLKGAKEKDTIIQGAQEEEKKIIESINKKALAELNSFKEKIADEAVAAKKNLEKEIDGFASEISRKILGRAV